MTRFEVKIEIHGRAFTLTKAAHTYSEMVREIKNDFGNVLILSTTNVH